MQNQINKQYPSLLIDLLKQKVNKKDADKQVETNWV